MTLGLGIVGAGCVARVHAGAAAQAGLRVAGVCDVREDRARALAAAHDGAVATSSLETLLADDGVEAVVVATPNALHAPVAVAALRAGHDVLLEKPMALNLGEARAVAAAAEEAGRLVQLGFVCRCAPAAQAARELVASGALGRIYHARASLCRRRGIPGLGGWFTTRALSGGGVLMDLGVHMLDLVLHLAGAPAVTRVSAVSSSTFGNPIAGYAFEEMWGDPPDPAGVFDVEDAMAALIRCDGGLSVELAVSWAADFPEGSLPDGIVLLGDRGGCRLELWTNRLVVTSVRDGRLVDAPRPLPEVNAWDAAWQEQARRFERAVASRATPSASAADGCRVQAVLDALYRSAADGREVDA